MSQSINGPIQLQEMLNNLRAEIGHSTNVAFGLNERQAMVYLLNRVQLDLWQQFDWPFLQGHRIIVLQEAVSTYNLPVDMLYEDINRIAWFDGVAQMRPLEYGVDVEQYALFNSLAEPPIMSSPPRRWRVTQNAAVIEVWPCPDASCAGGQLFLTGSLAPTPMVADSDMCTMPWRIIVLTAAAEVLASEKDPTSQVKAQGAAALIRRMKVRQGSHKSGVIPLGGRTHRQEPRVGLDYIPNGYGSGPSRS